MIKSVLLFPILFFFNNVAIGQSIDEIPKNQIDIGIGYQANLLKDANFSPLNQVGGGFASLLRYRHHSKNIFDVNFQFSPGRLNSGPSNAFKSSYINANLELAYLWKLTQKECDYHIYLGPAYNTRVLYLDWFDLEAFSFAASHGVSVKGLISAKINENNVIQSSLSIPFFQFLARPPYNGIDEFIIENQDNPAKIILSGKSSSFNNFIAAEFCIDYIYKFTKHIDWQIKYTLYSQRIKAPKLLKSLSNEIVTGIAINF